MNLVVFGLGYSSLRFVELFGDRFAQISGTVRKPETCERLRQLGIDCLDVLLFDGGAHQPEIAARTREADVMLVSVPPGQAGDLDVHDVPLGIRVAYRTIAPQHTEHAR